MIFVAHMALVSLKHEALSRALNTHRKASLGPILKTVFVDRLLVIVVGADVVSCCCHVVSYCVKC